MITPKERAQILLTQAELDRRRGRARFWRNTVTAHAVALGCLVSLATGIWLGDRSARREAEQQQTALLVRLGADPIKARCVVERITDDNRDLCLKLVTDGGDQ